MKKTFFFFYGLLLSLWVGGISVVTFLVTPVIFRSFGRDMAGAIVGKILPPYFMFNLGVSVLVLLLFLAFHGIKTGLKQKVSFGLLTAAIVINLVILFGLYPEIVSVKQQVVSFETEAPDSPHRKEFRKLHGISSLLNLLLLADGAVLLAIRSRDES